MNKRGPHKGAVDDLSFTCRKYFTLTIAKDGIAQKPRKIFRDSLAKGFLHIFSYGNVGVEKRDRPAPTSLKARSSTPLLFLFF